MSLRADTPNIHEKAAELMQRHRIQQIPVLDARTVLVDVILWLDYLEAGPGASTPCLDIPVVIMAGGKGTRLDPFTKILPKPLLPIGNKPMVQHVMDNLYKEGFLRFILVLNYKKEMVKMCFSEASLPYRVEFVDEDEQYQGTAGGLSRLAGKMNGRFVVTNCDTILKDNYASLLRWHEDKGNLMTIVGSHKELTIPYGVLRMSNGTLAGMDEKPLFDLFVNTGTYILEPEILGLLGDKEPVDMNQLIGRAIARYPDRISVYPHWGEWFDMGQLDEYRESVKRVEAVSE